MVRIENDGVEDKEVVGEKTNGRKRYRVEDKRKILPSN
jgi:hypothetical protein